MAYRRRTKRKMYKRKKTFRRHKFPLYKKVVNQGTIYYFKRTFQPSNVNFSTTAQNLTWKFSLSDLPNYTEFTTLYDQYQIAGVKVKFIPNNTQISIARLYDNGTGSNVQYAAAGVPQCITVLDYDDASALSAKGDYLQYQNCRMFNAVTPHKRYFRPHIASAVYQSAVFNGFANHKRSWIDVASASVEHYGMKMYMDSSALTINGLIAYQLYFTYYLKFKGVR